MVLSQVLAICNFYDNSTVIKYMGPIPLLSGYMVILMLLKVNIIQEEQLELVL